MKFRDFFQILRRPSSSRRYAYRVDSSVVDGVGPCRYAQWLHPREGKKEILASHVNGFRKVIQPGDFCIDVGAHSGDSTIPMAMAAGKSGTVLALEPNPFVFHVLEKNARSNRATTHIVPLMAAATVDEGFIEFEYSDAGYCNGGRHENLSVLSHGHVFKLGVFGINLENELRADFADLLPRLAFVKIDAEGYDLRVLQSIQGILREFSPHIKCEVFKKTPRKYRLDLLTLLSNLNYRVYRIEDEPITAGQEVIADNCEAWDHYDVFCVPGTVRRNQALRNYPKIPCSGPSPKQHYAQANMRRGEIANGKGADP